MKNLLVIFLCCIALIGAKCNILGWGRSPNHSPSQDKIIMFSNRNTINLIKDRATISEPRIEGDCLKFKISYSGGCNEHDFWLYGSKAFLESNPVQVEVLLSHDGKNDACDAWLTEELEFDLTPLKTAYKQAYRSEGKALLRIYEPGADEPFEPLLLYDMKKN